MFVSTIAIILFVVFMFVVSGEVQELNERIKELESRDPENSNYDPIEDPDLDEFDIECD